MLSLLRILLFSTITILPTKALADYYVIVNTNNPQQKITQREAIDLFMGRRRSFSHGEFVMAFDLPRNNSKWSSFYELLTGVTAAQVTSYWSRLMFSGQSLPPQPVPDEAAMIEIVKRHPNAIGWVTQEPNDKQVRTVLVLKE